MRKDQALVAARRMARESLALVSELDRGPEARLAKAVEKLARAVLAVVRHMRVLARRPARGPDVREDGPTRDEASRTEQRLDAFQAFLRGRSFEAASITQYLYIVRRALGSEEMMQQVEPATSPSAGKRARAALKCWAEFTRDPDLARRLRQLPGGSRIPPKRPTLSARARARIVAAIKDLPEPKRSASLLVVWSGRRVGELLGMSRRALETEEWSFNEGEIRPVVKELLAVGTGQTVGAMLSDKSEGTRYSVLRRALRKACKAARVKPVSPEEFRRRVRADEEIARRKVSVPPKAGPLPEER